MYRKMSTLCNNLKYGLLQYFKTRSAHFFSFLFCSFLFTSLNLIGQNLLPDGSFEVESQLGCVSPDQGFNKLEHWYLLDATPDLFETDCPFDEAGFVFWDESVVPLDGKNYAGLWSRWNSNGTYFTEGIATKLTTPLEAGKIYLFDMFIQNQGTFQGLVSSTNGCVLDPDRHIDLYTFQDSIKVINDFSNGTASTTAELVAVLNSSAIQGVEVDGWTQISTCFQATGGEQFFALIMPLGTFGPLPECAETNLGSGIFRSFYYNLDALSLKELPFELQTQLQVCAEQQFEVNLLELFDLPILENADFAWDDGATEATRTLSEKRNYSIEAQVDCASIQLSFNVVAQNCKSKVYVPNVFTPNADGINDTFTAYVSNSDQINNFRFKVFNRWGSLVFETTDPITAWDGKILGKAAETGAYIWVLSFEQDTPEGPKQQMETGQVLILR